MKWVLSLLLMMMVCVWVCATFLKHSLVLQSFWLLVYTTVFIILITWLQLNLLSFLFPFHSCTSTWVHIIPDTKHKSPALTAGLAAPSHAASLRGRLRLLLLSPPRYTWHCGPSPKPKATATTQATTRPSRFHVAKKPQNEGGYRFISGGA